MISPSPYFTAAEGLYLLSHHLENAEAKAIIKNEFKMLNHDTVISDSVAEILSLTSIIQLAIFQ